MFQTFPTLSAVVVEGWLILVLWYSAVLDYNIAGLSPQIFSRKCAEISTMKPYVCFLHTSSPPSQHHGGNFPKWLIFPIVTAE